MEKFLCLLINFFKTFVTTHREAHQEYQKQIASTKDKSKINDAKIAFAIVIVANLIARILLPLSLIALLILGLVKYFISILAVGFVAYLVHSRFSETKQKEATQQQQYNEAEYRHIAEFIFNPLENLEAWLAVKKPQTVTEIYCSPYANLRNGTKILTFAILKKSQEKIEEDKLSYAEKMLDHLLRAKLQKMQQEDLNGVYFFNGLPCLVANEIEDLGEKIMITILVINNQQAYNYYKHKITMNHQQPQKAQIQPFDEDF